MTIEFDPVRIGPSRRTRAPAVGVAIALLGFLGLAVLKPWAEAERSAAAPSVVPSVAAAPAPPARTTRPPPWVAHGAPAQAARIDPAGWSSPPAGLAAALRPHDDWGVRAVVERADLHGGIRPLRTELVERWEPAAPSVRGGLTFDPSATATVTVSEAVVLPAGDGPVRALGVTAPAGSTPLDLRAWWLGDGGIPVRLDVRPLDRSVGSGHLLLLPPRRSDGSADAWPAGTYRLDLLGAGRVTRLTVVLPAASGRARGSGRNPFAARPPDAADPFAADLTLLAPGPFVVHGARAMPVEVDGTQPMDEARSWLAGRERGSVTLGRVLLASVEAIGAVLPSGLAAADLRLERLAPVPLSNEPAGPGEVRLDRVDRHQAAWFRPPDGGAWPAGTYRLLIEWTDREQPRALAWHVEILAAGLRRDGAWSGPALGWARHAGETGFVTGTAEPLEGGPSAVSIRLHRQEPGVAPVDPLVLGPRCSGGSLVDAALPVVGVVHSAHLPLTGIRLERLYVGGRSVPERASTALDVEPGLSLIGPAPDEAWSPGYYRVLLDREGSTGATGATGALVLCVGDVRRGFAEVDPSTGYAGSE